MTTRDPGAREVLTHGFVSRPARPRASRADRRRPSPRVRGVRARRSPRRSTEPRRRGRRASRRRSILPDRRWDSRSATNRPSSVGFGSGSRCLANASTNESQTSGSGTRSAAGGAGHRGLDARQVQIQRLVERRRGVGIGPEEALRLRVALHAIGEVAASREAEVLERAIVDGEVRRGGSVLRAHVGQRRPVRS